MSVKLTDFGIFVRKMRLDNNEFLKDMAKCLDITPTYLSAIERGHRNVPRDWAFRIKEIYNLNDCEEQELAKAISNSRYYDKVDISHLSFEDKQLICLLSEKIDKIHKNEKEQLIYLLK